MIPPALADNAAIIYSVYLTAFIPLALIYGLDFITERWRTIRETHRNGRIQVSISLPCVGYVIFYIVLQIRKDDHKEAAAAIRVAAFNSYHIVRTVWGLVQLYEFRNWNAHALTCLIKLGYRAPYYPPSIWSKFMKAISSGLSHLCTFWRNSSSHSPEYGTGSSEPDSNFIRPSLWSLLFFQIFGSYSEEDLDTSNI